MGETAVTRQAHDLKIPGAIPGHCIPTHSVTAAHLAVDQRASVQIWLGGQTISKSSDALRLHRKEGSASLSSSIKTHTANLIG